MNKEIEKALNLLKEHGLSPTRIVVDHDYKKGEPPAGVDRVYHLGSALGFKVERGYKQLVITLESKNEN